MTDVICLSKVEVTNVIWGGVFLGNWFKSLQKVGKALMLPIAVLPAAALLLRLGAPDVLDIPFIAKGGGTGRRHRLSGAGGGFGCH